MEEKGIAIERDSPPETNPRKILDEIEKDTAPEAPDKIVSREGQRDEPQAPVDHNEKSKDLIPDAMMRLDKMLKRIKETI